MQELAGEVTHGDSLNFLYMLSILFGLSQGGIVPSYTMILRKFFPAGEACQLWPGGPRIQRTWSGGGNQGGFWALEATRQIAESYKTAGFQATKLQDYRTPS